VTTDETRSDRMLENGYGVESVRKAVRLLQALARGDGGVGVSALARELSLGKASAFRLLQTLTELGLVEQDGETRRYRLGPELVILGQAASEAVDFRRSARPVMEQLSGQAGMPSYLNVPGARDVVCLEHVPSLAGIDLYGKAGHTMPYHACPSGLVLLAFGPGERFERAASAGLQRYARNTITNQRRLRAALREVRARGYAVGVDDLEDGVTSVAAPIRDVHGAVVGALGLAGFSHLWVGRLDALAENVTRAAAEISLAGRPARARAGDASRARQRPQGAEERGVGGGGSMSGGAAAGRGWAS
jgi:IclR family transcriptional regulator, KDG regulon repressor